MESKKRKRVLMNHLQGRNKDVDIENRPEDIGQEGEAGVN